MREMTKIVVDGYEYTVRPGLKKGLMDSLKPYEGTRKAIPPPKPEAEKDKKKVAGWKK